MFFGLGPFSFGFGYGQQRPQQPMEGIQQYLNNSFLSPLFQSREHENPMNEESRPTFSRRESHKNKNKQKQEQVPKMKYDENTGIFWKIKGNEAYQKGDYERAVEYYTQAIARNNTYSVFFSNRAQCYKKQQRYQQALRDAQEAVELEDTNIRGHMISGQALAELGKRKDCPKRVENAIQRLTKALTLCGSKKPELQREISRYIYLAKKLLWYLKFNEIRNTRIQVINEYQKYVSNDPGLTKEEAENRIIQFMNATDQPIIFAIPDHLQCRITLELMEDPVTTDCGQTYERSAIEEHIQRNGKTDPFTRSPLKGPLYPNVSIKKAIADFLNNNPWAYEYSEGENYKDIVF